MIKTMFVLQIVLVLKIVIFYIFDMMLFCVV